VQERTTAWLGPISAAQRKLDLVAVQQRPPRPTPGDRPFN